MDELHEEGAERHEFPKMLYEGGHVRDDFGRPVRHDHTRIVNDAEEEAAARAEGFTDAGEPEKAAEEGPDTQTAPAGESTETSPAGDATQTAPAGPDTVSGTSTEPGPV